MDAQGDAVWKWYGDTPNNLAVASGRSSSWSNVSDFFEYARDNAGFGLVAVADAPFSLGEPGDIIQLGLTDHLRHSVVITQALYDESGRLTDYLVNSNTANLKNFPISAYPYANLHLIKIYGYRDAS